MTVRDRVQAVFADVFDNPGIQLRDDMGLADVPGWDSLHHINLIVAVESEFGVQFGSEEVASAASVGDIFALLESAGVRR
jgi:acyl carrier protein